jgi:hypothetical protein
MHQHFKFIHSRCPKWPQFLAATMASSPLATIYPHCQTMATIPAAISSKQLREIFMEFFITRAHQRIPSAPILDKHRCYISDVQQVCLFFKCNKDKSIY